MPKSKRSRQPSPDSKHPVASVLFAACLCTLACKPRATEQTDSTTTRRSQSAQKPSADDTVDKKGPEKSAKKPRLGGSAKAKSATSSDPQQGGRDSNEELDYSRITYQLSKEPNADSETQGKYREIESALDQAIELYLRHTALSVRLKVTYNPSVPTAQAKPSDDTPGEGIIDFGGSISKRVAMHELGHVFGAGFWGNLGHDGEFHGPLAKAKLEELDGPGAKLNADSQHFWPYGLNLDSDVKSDQDYVNHCLMVEAIHQDIENAKKTSGYSLRSEQIGRDPIP